MVKDVGAGAVLVGAVAPVVPAAPLHNDAALAGALINIAPVGNDLVITATGIAAVVNWCAVAHLTEVA